MDMEPGNARIMPDGMGRTSVKQNKNAKTLNNLADTASYNSVGSRLYTNSAGPKGYNP